jgi:hypothetical protein
MTARLIVTTNFKLLNAYPPSQVCSALDVIHRLPRTRGRGDREWLQLEILLSPDARGSPRQSVSVAGEDRMGSSHRM